MSLPATVDTVSPAGALYRVVLEEGSLTTDAITGPMAGGCLIQERGSGLPPARFQITRGSAEAELSVLVRPVAGGEPTSGPCRIETAPDYSRLAARPHKLRQLADKPENEDAFSVVTGVPVAATTFRDEIPGVGRNAFFYRVRAVDPADSRSAWSLTSVPFWPLDTTPPAPPRDLVARPGDRSAELRWTAPTDPKITTYHVYRLEGSPEAFHPARVSPIVVPAASTEPARPTMIAGSTRLPGHVQDVDPAGTVVQALVSGAPAGPNLFVGADQLTRLAGRRVEGLNPLVPDGTTVRVWVDDPETAPPLTHRPGSGEPLTIQQGAVDLSFGLTLMALEAVFLAERVRQDADLAGLLSLPVPEELVDAPRDLDGLTIGGLGTLFPDGTEVVAVVRLADGSLRAIHEAPGRDEPLRVAGGSVRLDLDLTGAGVRRVERAEASLGVDLARPAVPVPDLRLVTPSAVVVEPGSHGGVVAIEGLNPLVADGTPVGITLATAHGERRFDADPGTRTWRDTGLRGGTRYHYWLAALRPLRSSTSGVGASSGAPDGLIRSDTAGPVPAVPLDRSEPLPPRLTGVAWVDAEVDGARKVARLTLEAPAETTAVVRAQRAAQADGPWSTVSRGGDPGWGPWPAGTATHDLTDPDADPARRWWYRAQRRTLDDRMSPPSDPVELSPAGG
jgi:hypothetical protein